MHDFSQRLKSLRQSMGLTQKQFGALGGVTDTAQGNYESDDESKRKAPGLNYFLNLKENDIDISYLLTGETASDNLNADESLILETFRNSNEQSKKLILDLCRTLSGLPEQPKKKDDQYPPKSGSRHKSGDITTGGGSIGDIIQGDNNIKSTTHNYEFLSPEEIEEINEKQRQADIKRNFKLEDIFKGYSVCENVLSQIVLIASLFGVLYLMREIATVPAVTPEEQIISLIFSTLIPITFGFVFYKEIRKKIKYFFDDRREKARRRILLERF